MTPAHRAPATPFNWRELVEQAQQSPVACQPRVWRIGLTVTDRVTGRARRLTQLVAATAMLEAVVEARSRLLARGYWLYLGPKGLAGDPAITEC